MTRVRNFLNVLPLLALACGGCANGIFYHPDRSWAPTPDRRGLAYEHVEFRSIDGTPLSAWWLPARGKAKGTVLHYHGNAQNMSTHVRFAEWLPSRGYNLLVFDYRGYGKSGGAPHRKGVMRDGMAALRLAGEKDDTGNLFVWGQSLGGTVALQSMLRTEVPVRAAVIDSAFYSFPSITAEKLKLLPWYLQWLRVMRPLLVTGGYDANDALRNLDPLPLAFLHGENDPVIPASHSRRLRDIAPGNPPLWIIPNAGHCDAALRYPDQVQPLILDFFQANRHEGL